MKLLMFSPGRNIKKISGNTSMTNPLEKSKSKRLFNFSLGYIGRPREAEIPDLEVSFESLDSLLEREKQFKN
ncbi:hypothetical protein SPRA44_380015 [Serratia proteamaculans]|nr:hypothetical protein SPRA44_380015 [Serratia proteamaculans]